MFSPFLEWLWADYLLYDHFKHVYDNLIFSYGRDRLDLEKDILRTEAHLTEIECRAKKYEGDCNLYRISEIDFLDMFRKRQDAERMEILKRQEVEQKAKLKSLEQKRINFIINKFKHNRSRNYS